MSSQYPRTFPIDNPMLHEQTQLSEITDQEYHDAWFPPKISCCKRFLQFWLLFLTLGIVRFLLIIGFFLIYLVLMLPIVIFSHWECLIKKITWYGITVTRGFIRILMYCLGIVWVQKKGNYNPNARNYIYNHTSLMDGLMIYYAHPFSVVCHAGLRKVPVFGQILYASQAVFIDRSKQSGNSQAIKERMEDYSKLPCATAPEGKISNGTILFKFRTGGFLANVPIQPVTIRYHQIWSFGCCSFNWLCDGFFEWLFGVLCVPFTYVTLTYLPTILPTDQPISPQIKAMQCQLDMANQLGCLAINRTSREIFESAPAPSTNSSTVTDALLGDQQVRDPYVG